MSKSSLANRNLNLSRYSKGISICIIGAIFYCYEFVLRAAPGIMVHELMTAYRVSAESIGVLSVFYHYAYAPLQLPAGVMIDRYGPRKLLSMSALLCTLGTFLMYSYHSINIGCFAQLLIGAGSAFAFVGALKLAANWLPIHLFPLFAGITTALGMAGAMGTDALLINLVSWIGWHNIWLHLSFTGIIISAIMFLFLRDKPSSSNYETSLSHSNNNWGDFFSALKQLFTSRVFWVNSIVGGILFLPITVIGTLWGVPFLMDGYGYDHQQAGLATSLIFLGMGIGGPIAGYLAELTQNRLLILRVGGLGATICTFILMTGSDLSYLGICLTIFSIGLSLGPQILVFPIAVDLLELKYSGTALAATNFSLMMWGVLIQPVIGKTLDFLWDGKTIDGHALYQLSDYEQALFILPVLCACALLLSFLIPKHWRKPTTHISTKP